MATASIVINPDAHYRIATITDNGSPVTIANPYNIANVSTNHTVVVTFEMITHDITATAGSGGSINPSGTSTVNDGENLNLQHHPGYRICHHPTCWWTG